MEREPLIRHVALQPEVDLCSYGWVGNCRCFKAATTVIVIDCTAAPGWELVDDEVAIPMCDNEQHVADKLTQLGPGTSVRRIEPFTRNSPVHLHPGHPTPLVQNQNQGAMQ